MTILFYAIAVFVVILTPSVLHFGFKLSGKKMKTVLGLNVFSFAALLMAAIVIMLGDSGVLAQEAGQASGGATSMGYLAAALVTGLASIGAGIAVAASASAAIGAISEDASVMGKALIFVALAEGIALYGLLISFTILSSL
jgi:V/A-type H+-transporting ATPase subunit K